MSSIPGPENIRRHTLSNGIVVMVYENHNSPSVAIRGYLWAGGLDEKPSQLGLAAFTTDSLTHGAGKRSMIQIYDEVESIGASIGVDSDRQLTGFGAKCLAEDTRFILGILADVLRRPRFPAVEVERVRGEFLTGLEMRAHDTRAMADLAFREMAYPGHPYSYSLDGTLETVKAIKRKDLFAFHETFFSPHRMTFSFAGAVKDEDALAWVAETFGDWQATRPERTALDVPKPIEKITSRHTAIPGKTQTDLVLGFHGPARSAEDFMAARVANNVLGVFGMMGRLGDNVRERQGLAYYSYSRIEGGLGPGPWAMIAGVNPAQVERAAASIVDEVHRLVDELVPAEELAENQSSLTGSMPLALETNDSLARIILDLELFDLGLDYLQHYHERITSLTPEQIQAAAQHYLDPERYVLATAGPETKA